MSEKKNERKKMVIAEEKRRIEAIKKKVTDAISLVDEMVPVGQVIGNRPEKREPPRTDITERNWWRKGGGNTEMYRERRPYVAEAIGILGSDMTAEELVLLCHEIDADAGAVAEGLKKANVDLARIKKELNLTPYSDENAMIYLALTALLKGDRAANQQLRSFDSGKKD